MLVEETNPKEQGYAPLQNNLLKKEDIVSQIKTYMTT